MDTLPNSDQVVCHIIATLCPTSVLVIGKNAEGLARAIERCGLTHPSVSLTTAATLAACKGGMGSKNCSGSGDLRYDLVLVELGADGVATMVPADVVEYVSSVSKDAILYGSVDAGGRRTGACPVLDPWIGAFAVRGYYRDLSFEFSPFGSEVFRFVSDGLGPVDALLDYERHLQVALLSTRTSLDIARWELEQHARFSPLVAKADSAARDLLAWRRRWSALESGLAWPLTVALQRLRSYILPEGSRTEDWLQRIVQRLRYPRGLDVEPVWLDGPPPTRTPSVDVVICVHNAFDDVRRCLESVLDQTDSAYGLILVDDGSDEPTRRYLERFALDHRAQLLRNEVAQGYTVAANRGLRLSRSEFCVLLNSDTVVSAGWLKRMVACADTDERIGLVGPLSNTASWQSIPRIADGDDWAENPLPQGVSVQEMGTSIAEYSARVCPRVPFLNGFCLMVRRRLIDCIGYFDEARFGRGYGEEDDYAIRARKAGWVLAIADDVYIYHAQSRSYTPERRHVLSEAALRQLMKKHGRRRVARDVAICSQDRVLEGIRARSRVVLERRGYSQSGRRQYAGKRVLFVLPVAMPGGGANIVISEAMAMRRMGVDARVFNRCEYRIDFERAYPQLEVPVVYGVPSDLRTWASRYDAVIATHNESVSWLQTISVSQGSPVLAYYVQGFEPLIYPRGSGEYERAMQSYTAVPDLVRLTKTSWTADMVLQHTGAHCVSVGPSFELDLFCPRPQQKRSWPQGPLRVAAMVRPETAYRAPALTMAMLRKAVETHKHKVEAVFFGADTRGAAFRALSSSFRWRSAGILSPWQAARFLNEVDVFVDFSEHQAMGLTALEAMGCGAAVIVPRRGGASSFVRDGVNGLVVDTDSEQDCWDALSLLIRDDKLREELRRNAMYDVVRYHPQGAAFRMLEGLFGSGDAP